MRSNGQSQHLNMAMDINIHATKATLERNETENNKKGGMSRTPLSCNDYLVGASSKSSPEHEVSVPS